MHDVLLNKLATIKRCLVRISQEFSDDDQFRINYTKQDSVVLNLQRACEAAIDSANFLIKQHSLGIPQSARNSFDLIASANIITPELANALKKMVGLRNIAVHDYQALNLDIVIAVVKNNLSDFELFCTQITKSVDG